MAFAAVPNYLGEDFSTAPPGHRFYLYFQIWSQNHAGTLTIKPADKPHAVDRILNLNPGDQKTMQALAKRQQAMAGDHVWQLPTRTVAPLTTGLGMEHPLENGFAFLNPYGLPYLPGSSIKGVLRQAARDLAADKEAGWNQSLIDRLFGPETQDDDNAHRGALVFWDALPVLPGDSLMTEVMTPHQGEYHEGKAPPHDSGQPNPILFLALPPNTRLNFFVDCDRRFLDPAMTATDWQQPLREAFEYACDWLGFGAKTAVGYGHLEIDTKALQARQEEQAERQVQAQKQAELEQQMQGCLRTPPP